jgi:uncharacterized protein involved in outer membrane biogenesis
MGKGSKKIYWAAFGTAFLLVLLIGLAVVVPRVVDSAWLKKTIQAAAAKQVPGDFDFQKAELSILPSPFVALRQVSLNIPETARVTLDTIKVYPRFFPLLLGNIELDKIVIDRPALSVALPDKQKKEKRERTVFSLSEVLEAASKELSPIISAIPGLEVSVHEGTLRLFAEDKEVFLFENINGELEASTRSLTITISSKSNIWESVDLKAKLTPASQEAKGSVTLKKLTNKALAQFFMAANPPLSEESFVNLQMNFSVNPEDGLKTDIKSSGASFTALHESKKVTAHVENLKSSIHYTDNLSTITIDNLTLSNPQIELASTFNFDETIPHASLDIKSQSADITSVREVLPVFIAAFFGDLSVVKEIFAITRGGTISQASFHAEGKSLADLAEFESMLIQGHVADADISLSDLGLDLHEVSGDINIANGVLEGKNLQAKQGNTTGSNGTLKYGLVKKETTPFHLDLELNADLSEVPPLLKKLLPDKNVQYYLSQLENLQGTAHGILTLGDSLESLKVRVEVDKIKSRAEYKPIPYPISVDGGRVIYEGLKIQSHGIQGKIGNSTFSNYSDKISWEGEPTVDVKSGTFHLVMDEIFTWLTSNKKLAEELKGIKDISGIVEITAKSVKGPLLMPAKLQYELQGTLKNVILTATKLPGPLTIKSGQAYIMPDKISFESLQAELLDSSITYSGVLQDFIAGRTNADIIVTEATLGHEVNIWLVEEIGAPEEYQFRTPLLISRMYVDWTKEELLDLQGDFSIKNGPIFSVDIMLNPDELVLRHLIIKNGTDQASMRLELKKRTIGAEFTGSLSKQTIDKILIYRDVDHNAWIKGDIRFHIDMDSFADSTANGKLEGGDFIFPWEFEKNLVLESYSLSAADKTINLNSAEAVFENKNFSLIGAVSLAPERLSMDFDIRTDIIDLDSIIGALKEKENGGEAEEQERIGKSWDLTLGANINIHAESLLYNGYTWEPFESQITFENSYFSIEVLEAELCNISTPAKLSLHDGKISLDFQMLAKDQEITELMICLGEGEQQVSGTFNIKAAISGHGSRDNLVNSLQGDLQFIAKEGKIYQDAQMAKVLYLLNVTNLFKGKIPDLASEGFYYNSIIIRGTMDQGVLAVNPAKLEAPIMQIAANGTIDLPEKKINLLVLVAPLQTLNKIQKILPVIGTIIPSSLAAVPVEVTGDIRDIKVRALSMSAIGTRTFGIMVDALRTPVRILEGSPGEAK